MLLIQSTVIKLVEHHGQIWQTNSRVCSIGFNVINNINMKDIL